MLISKFPAASSAVFPVASCPVAQTGTRLPEAGVIASRDEAQGYTPLVSATGTRTDTALRDLPLPVAVIPKEALRPQCALHLDDAIHNASDPSLFDRYPLSRLRAAPFPRS